MSTQVLRGRGASPGIAIGPVYFFAARSPIPHYRMPKKKIPAEKRRLEKAFLQAQEQWQETLDQLSRFQASEQLPILQSHLLILQDPLFLQLSQHHVQEDLINAEWAVELTGQHLSIALAGEDQISSYKRSEAIRAVITKILNNLTHRDPLSGLDRSKIKRSVLVADDISPEMVPLLKNLNVLGFVTRTGGLNAHTMILARALCLPAVSGIENVLEILTPGRQVILNGFEGTLLVNPSAAELKKHRELLKKHELLEKLFLTEAKKPAWTRDKKRIRLEANVELLEEVPALWQYGAEGIGLFRTETLFWNPNQIPNDRMQARYYFKVLRQMKNLPVTFRTLDVSGDLWLNRAQTNPALGLRGIRFGLKEVSLLRTQLKALLKASAQRAPRHSLRILLPMVSSVEEIESFQSLLKEVRKEIQSEKKTVPPKIPIGVMIEVPAAGLLTEQFAKHVDFFAIGSNDLIQYTLAMDRTNEQLSDAYSSYHPAVLKILFQIVQNALKAKKPIYLCGELGGDPLFLPVLLGLGIRHFSMNPLSIPRAKKVIRSLSMRDCARWLQKLMKLTRAQEIERELRAMRFKLDTPWWAG